MTSLDETFGVALIGVIVAASLYGVTCVQTWYYYTYYPKDHWYIKLLVALCLASDTIHQMLISHTIYTYLVTNFGNPVQLGGIVWSLIVEVMFNGFTALIVQSFLAMRIWRLSNKSILAVGSVMVLVIAEFLCVMVYAGRAINFETFTELSTLKSLSMAVNGVAAAGDVLIALILCALLQNSRTGFRRSDTIINRLILFSINTGLLTSFCAVASLIAIAAAPTTFIYIAFYFCLGRLYCNSLLATLNARKSMRSEQGEDISLSYHGGSSTQTNPLHSTKRRTNNVSLKVDGCLQDELDKNATFDSSQSDRDMKVPIAV